MPHFPTPAEVDALSRFQRGIVAMIHYVEALAPETRTTAQLTELRDLFVDRLAGGMLLLHCEFVVGSRVYASRAFFATLDDLYSAAHIYLDALPVLGTDFDRELADLLGGAA